jgi:hypothetical protein
MDARLVKRPGGPERSESPTAGIQGLFKQYSRLKLRKRLKDNIAG